MLIGASVCSAQGRVDLDESDIRAPLRFAATTIAIPVRNTTARAVDAQLHLEWLDQRDVRLSARLLPVSIPVGKSDINAKFPLPAIPSNAQIYLRLRYTLAPANPDTSVFSTMTGTVALSTIAQHAFILQSGRLEWARPGTSYVVRVQAVQAHTRKAVPGVRFESVLQVDDRQITPSNTRSDAEGTAVLTFSIPGEARSRDRTSLKAVARLGDFRQEITLPVTIRDQASARIETDKRLYQPGQTLHMRALVLDPAGRASGQTPVRVQLHDPKGEAIREVGVTTSKFGVVHQDFDLPATADLGSYRISVSTEKGARVLADDFVNLSRYELPAFAVMAKANRPFYLPGQDAVIEISATYLFGKPVPGTKVRVEQPRTSNDRSFRVPVAEGEADDSGHFLAHVALGVDHAEFERTPRLRFQDLPFEVFCSDPSSGRTEQLRLDLRLTHDPIHVYVTYGDRSAGPLPVPVYISTWYADGTPAQTTGEVRLGAQSASLRTNQFGVARVLLSPHSGVIEVSASDAAGKTAQWRQEVYLGGEPSLRVRAGKPIYRQGEPVALTIEAPDASLDVSVNAMAQGRTIESRRAQVRNGVAHLEFPYRPEFQRLVIFSAFTGDCRVGHSAVVYPDGAALTVTATPRRPQYRPGEDASVDFQVSAAPGQSLRSVLGVAVVDQAVAERVRTNAEFGRTSRPYRVAHSEHTPGGLTQEILYELDLSQDLPPGLELAAEALLAGQRGGLGLGSSVDSVWWGTFQPTIEKQFGPVADALDRAYAKSLVGPRDRAEVGLVLSADGLALDDLQDPWGTRYAVEFLTRRSENLLRFGSAGPDKAFGTVDDFTAYEVPRPHFRPYRVAIEHAFRRWGQCPRDLPQLRSALAGFGVVIDKLSDPWGTAYESDMTATPWMSTRFLVFRSAGPDRRFGTGDDFEVDRVDVPCPVPHEAAIREALDRAATFPVGEEQLRGELASAGINASQLVDPWGQPFLVTVEFSERFADEEQQHTVNLYGRGDLARVKPLSQRSASILLRSAGDRALADRDTSFRAAVFEGVVDPVPLGDPAGSGELCGVVRSESGAVVSRANIKLVPAVSSQSGPVYRTRSNVQGGFCVRGVNPGHYTLIVERTGHRPYQLAKAPVADGYITVINVDLQPPVNTRLFAPPSVVGGVPGGVAGGVISDISTPPVRSYFPETLLWAPEVQTDILGRAHVDFKLADNITSWRLAVTASTEDGRVARAAADIRSFQPFFVDLSPPPILTVGDRIDLPVSVRNYLDQMQSVTLEMQPNQWAESLGSARSQFDVPANDSRQPVYSFRAKSTIDDGRLQATAIGATSSDAIEKPVRVHLDGQESTETASDLVAGQVTLRLAVPAKAIPGGTRGELRIYPSPLAAIRDAMTGLLARPYGCAEQTTSAGQSNLVALQYARSIGFRDSRFESQAIRNLELTRDRLKSYQAPGGGFSYWTHGSADLAVTAYVLRFLTEASALIAIEPKLIEATATWLLHQRGADGRWGAEAERSWATTALVARGLAAARHRYPTLPAPPLADLYAAVSNSASPSPYVIAQMALAAMDTGDTITAGKAAAALKRSVHDDFDGNYWPAATGMAFGGWGRPAVLETTAAAVTALARWRTTHPSDTAIDPLIRRGVLHLLRNRDRYGVWFSTQATVAVMHAMVATAHLTGGANREGGQLDLVVNGRPLRRVSFERGDTARIDISRDLRPGDNEVRLAPAAGAGAFVAIASATYWLSWADAEPRSSPELQFHVAYDRTDAPAGAEMECQVSALRTQGGGMLLAEIGLPPGAEVDRSSLEAAIQSRQAHLYRYDIQPDRVVLYLWPYREQAFVRFTFHARFGMEAKTPPSVLYDYYNPEAMAEVPPTRFQIR